MPLWLLPQFPVLPMAGDPSLIPGPGRSTREGIGYLLQHSWASPVAQLVKNLPALWETWVQSLSWEDPLEKGKATHSSILAWRIRWTILHGVAKSQGFSLHFTFTMKSLCCCCYYSVAKLCPTLCHPMDCSTPGFPVHHHLPKPAQTHVR